MKKSVKTQKFNYPIDEVTSLLLDVDNYKNFIPMRYSEAELLKKTPTFQKALIKLKIPLLKVELITDYKIIDDNNIEVSMQGGPFKVMQGHWEFKKIDDKSSQVKLTSKYSFKNIILEKTISPIIGTGLSSQVIKYFFKGLNQK